MWFYIGTGVISAAVAATLYYFRETRPTLSNVAKVYKTIRKNGISVCFVWMQQIIANRLSARFVEMHHRYYIVNYPFGVKWYKILIPRNRRPCTIDEIHDENGDNVRDNVFTFMGPSHNFHGIAVTPKMLGYGSLKFIYIDGEETAFKENDKIQL